MSQATIIGLVDASGSAGFQRSDDQWHLVLHLAAWRLDASLPIEKELRCEQAIEEAQLKDLMATIGPYSVLKFKASLNAEQTLATISNIESFSISDYELDKISQRLKQSIVQYHELIGQLQYERAYSFYQGTYAHSGNTVKVYIQTGDPNDYVDLFSDATALLQSLTDWENQAKHKAAKDLLALGNDWQDNDNELTESEFIARLSLESVVIEGDGEFSLWFDDGDIFYGHGVTVYGTLQEGLTDAQMQ